VLEQSEPDLELIVADNANTDETPEILAEFAGDRRLRVVRHAAVQSVTDNWMSTLESSRGDYLVMIGDDDCLLPTYFERVSELLARHDNPDCLVYNGYSYVFPGAVAGNPDSYFAAPHFRFDGELTEGALTPKYRRTLLEDMFRFLVRYPLNMQLTMFSRKAKSLIPRPFFRPPFPDHFAINSLLLKANVVVYAPDKLVVIGVSPKSFGHFVYGGDHDHGMTYLGSKSSFPGRLEGNELLSSMYEWLELLKRAYAADLGDTKVDRGAYVRRQVAYWLIQYRHGVLPLGGLGHRVARLTAKDWWHVTGTAVDPASWRRLSRLPNMMRRDRARSLWPGLKPLPGVSNMAEFVRFVTAGDVQQRIAAHGGVSGD
jgi:glycosyltransferase involved in cell wall biosynthesis